MARDWLEKKPDEYPVAIQVAFSAGGAPVAAESLAVAAPEIWYFTPGFASIPKEDTGTKKK